MALKFGSKAWRAKYAPKKKKRTAKRKTKNTRRRRATKNPASVLKKIKALLK